MSDKYFIELRQSLKKRAWQQALLITEKLLLKNQLASNLHLLKGNLLQLQEDEDIELKQVEKAYKWALKLDPQYLEAWLELYHFYDVVIENKAQKLKCKKTIKALIKKILAELDYVSPKGE